MQKNKLSSIEQMTLRNKAKNKLEEMEQILIDDETKEILNEFKNKFNMCETVYKVIFEKYNKCNGNISKGFLKITMNQVPAVLKFSGYSFDKWLLNEIFGSSAPQNKRTIKKLRDAITHGIEKKAVEEIIVRKDELFGYMNVFLDEIRNFDSNVI